MSQNVFVKKINLVFFFLVACTLFSYSQQEEYIRSREGKPILPRRAVINNCLQTLKKGRNDTAAIYVCECRAFLLQHRFTNAQYRKHTKGGVIDLGSMLKEDTLFDQQMNECFTSSGKTVLLRAEGFEEDFISICISNIQRNSEKRTEYEILNRFCKCQLDLIKSKKVSDKELEQLKDPNSVFYYQMIYNCGDPFAKDLNEQKGWTQSSYKDITGPEKDTVPVLSINNMSYVKVKIGQTIQVWLMDTGASDLLISAETEILLKNDGVLTTDNFIGTGEYEMANGQIDTCRKYKINNFKIGGFTVNNLTLAVTDKGKRNILGKTLFNKFRKWEMDNKENRLILEK